MTLLLKADMSGCFYNSDSLKMTEGDLKRAADIRYNNQLNQHLDLNNQNNVQQTHDLNTLGNNTTED